MIPFIHASLLALLMLYSWSGVCYLALLLIYRGPVERQRQFLETHYRFFILRTIKQSHPELTSKVIRGAGSRGWGTIWLPIFLMAFGLTFWNVLLSAAVIFFGGLFFAYSWYGLRCLGVLGLDSVCAPRPYKLLNR